MDRKDDLEVLKQAKPFIRSILAFIVYVRFGTMRSTDECYINADKFIDRLEKDLRA